MTTVFSTLLATYHNTLESVPVSQMKNCYSSWALRAIKTQNYYQERLQRLKASWTMFDKYLDEARKPADFDEEYCERIFRKFKE